MKRISFLIIQFTFILQLNAQDTLTVMYYNILSYTPANFEKTHYLKDITKSITPDILVLNEISSDSVCWHILNFVLNTEGDTNYSKAEFTDGPNSDNMLFYNSDKLKLLSQDTVQTDLRLINGYELYLNDPVFTSQYDSVKFWVFGAHLKASLGTANEQQRLVEVQKFIQHLLIGDEKKNILFGGDMNFYSSKEPALEYLLSPGPYQFFDPLDAIGDWHDYALYSHLHTQSTRTIAFGGGAAGGLDDRFDFIFISDGLKNGTNYAKYLSDTYLSFGNDGYHLNDSITSLPHYNNLPDNITDALYRMSDHLPVIMKIIVNYDVSIYEKKH